MGVVAPRRSARAAAAAASAAAVPTPPAQASTPPTKKKRSAASKPKKNVSPKKTKLTGLKTAILNPAAVSSTPGVVDPESRLKGTVMMHDGEICDIMLALVDPSKHNDKYFILQLIQENVAKSKPKSYVVYTRWGRTGTTGQALVQRFEDNLDEAQKSFESKFHGKTGLPWDHRSDPFVGTKYRWIAQNYAQKSTGYTDATWQYWVDDGVDGKPTGWYDYDPAASAQVEALFSQSAVNGGALNQRTVASGLFTYAVCLQTMVQTNVTHASHTSRRIRRCPANTKMDNAAPDPVPSTLTSKKPAATPKKKKAAAPPANTTATPKASPPVPSSAIVTPMKSSSSSTVATAATTKAPPVDPEIILHGGPAQNYTVAQSTETGTWYNAVLNQCNITGSNNNNKYYRLQIVTDSSGSFFCWQKWGRVGERGTRGGSGLKGPYATEEQCLKEFAKKFRDKTKNAWGADPFVPKSGKYTLIEIDDNVDTTNLAPAQGVSTDTSAAKVKTEFLPSKLEDATKELVETIFSKNTREAALKDFNIDLKRLPLGVPSQQQIETGLGFLEKIEEKLDGDDVPESFEDLSSQFYTSIPHSFGRSRPPRINDKESLQSRFDMCNILMDMYTASETVRKIEEKKVVETTTIPHPVDAHYDSLKTDLSIVEWGSKEYQMINQYFEKTKSNTNARLLNIWRSDRNGEATRFEQFDQIDNRKLLWHGTNVAVVAPILMAGLRIMPHSGGRVGAGIYLASMNAKSAQYTSSRGAKFACMFLCEAALGKSHEVTQDGQHASSLKAAPVGFDSVHAVGTTQPKTWKPLHLDNKKVMVPQSEGTQNKKLKSTFGHDEFLVYDESQVRLRYVVSVKLY